MPTDIEEQIDDLAHQVADRLNNILYALDMAYGVDWHKTPKQRADYKYARRKTWKRNRP